MTASVVARHEHELVSRYVEELGRPFEVPSREALFALHRAHVQRFSHDTVWIARGRIPPVDVEAMVEAILDGDGGVCTQLGLGFAWLLPRLGYDARLHCADVQLGLDDDFRDWPQHPIVTVDVEGRTWYADVGMGNGLLEPIPCEEGVYEQAAGLTYALVPVDGEPGVFHFRQDPSVRGVRRLRVDVGRDATVEDFDRGFRQLVHAEESPFRRTVGAARRTPERVVALNDDHVVRRTSAGRRRTRLSSAQEWEAVLREDFLLELPDWTIEERDRLWARASGVG